MKMRDPEILGAALLVLAILCLLDWRIPAILAVIIARVLLGGRVSDYWVISFSVGLAISVIPLVGLAAPIVLLVSTIWYREMTRDVGWHWRQASTIIYAVGAILQPLVGIRLIGLAILLQSLAHILKRS